MSEEKNDFNLGQFGQNLLDLAGGYYIGKEGAEQAIDIGQQAFEQGVKLAEDVGSMAEFKPFTVTTGLGQATTTDEGGYSLAMSPEQQALQNQLLSASTGLFGQVGVDPSTAQADLYEQMRAVQRPEEERQRLALEERMLSQGRLGLQSSAYGGSSPELLAQETARQEAMARANLAARQQSMAEQQQALQLGTGLMTQGYVPQQQALTALGYGVDLAKLPQYGRQAGAEFYGQAGLGGIEALMQGLQEASGYDLAMKQGLLNTAGGMLGGGLDADLSTESVFPSNWSEMSDFERALWLYNRGKD